MIVVLFAGVAFAGCALFERDVKYYNNQTVARIDTTTTQDIEITKKDLMDAFNSYGYQYVTSFNYSLKEAYDQTLELLINREIVAEMSRQRFGDLTDHEEDQIRKTSFEAVERGLREIEKEIRKEKNWVLESEEATTSTEDTPKGQIYTPYQKYLIKQGNYYRVNLEKFKDRPIGEFVMGTEAFIDSMRLPRGSGTLEESIANLTFDRLIRRIANNEKGLGHKYDTLDQKKKAIEREINRIQGQERRNKHVQRMQDTFEQGIITDADYDIMMKLLEGVHIAGYTNYESFVDEKNKSFVQGLVHSAEADYREKLRTAVFRYENGFDNISGYGEKLLGNLADVYFVPKQVADQFFTVSHILLEYSEDQKKQLEQINERARQDKSFNKEGAIDSLRANVMTSRRDEAGAAIGTPMTPGEVLRFVEMRVAPNNTGKSYERKAADFRDCIYMFNSDPGMVNPEFEYVIGIDIRKDKSLTSTEAETMSKMVPEFTKASRDLFNYNEDEKRGGVEKVYDMHDKTKFEYVDLRGSMSGLVWTDYGAHIIMYTRNISDFIYTNTSALIDATYHHFLHSTQTSYGNKTYFDAAVERITRPSYDRYEQNLLTMYKSEHTITTYKSRYKDLTKTK